MLHRKNYEWFNKKKNLRPSTEKFMTEKDFEKY